MAAKRVWVRNAAAVIPSILALVLLLEPNAGGAARLRGSAVAENETPGEVLTRAREAAAADRHREAIDLYLRAVEADTTLISDVSLELGHQYTWAGIPDSAIVWYEARLARNPGDLEAEMGMARALSWADRLGEAEKRYTSLLPESGEERTDVLLGLARVEAWQEDYGGAEDIYQEVLASDTANVDARLGLGTVWNWAGRHRAAKSMFEDVLAVHPRSTEAIKGLAEADLWIGRPDRALQTLDRAFADGIRDDDLERTADAIRGMGDPSGSTSASYRENTDDGIIRGVSASATWPLDYLTEAGVLYLNEELHKQGYPDIHRNVISVSISRRFSDALSVTAIPGYEFNRFDAVAVPPGSDTVDSFDLVVWDVWVTVVPRDWVRIDAGTSRETMDIPLPVFKRIDVTTEKAGLDWRPLYRLATFWEAKYSDYSDGNWRFGAAERVEWTAPMRLPYRQNHRFVVMQGAEYSSFDEQLDNGYYCPPSYVYLYGGLRFVADVGKRANLLLDGRFGGEKDDGSGWTSVGAFEGTLRVRVSGSAVMTAGYFKSGSRLDSPDGFRAEGVYLTLDLGGAP